MTTNCSRCGKPTYTTPVVGSHHPKVMKNCKTADLIARHGGHTRDQALRRGGFVR